MSIQSSMMRQALARKWRPRDFSTVIGQAHIVRMLRNALERNYNHHAYLFTGTRGVGKTTIARILAKCFNCEKAVSADPCNQCSACLEIDQGHFPDLIEVDAAFHTKVEDTRGLLDNVQYTPTKGRFKIYLIDEVHMLSGHSFNALLKTLEEPPHHVKFLLATTDPGKLPPTVLSRCLQFHLTMVPPEIIDQHLQHLLAEEKIPFAPTATLPIAQASRGSIRDALSLLDQAIAYGNGEVHYQDVQDLLGFTDQTTLYRIITALSRQDANALFAEVEQLSEQGCDFQQVLAELLDLFHQIAVEQIIKPKLTANNTQNAELKVISQQISSEDIQLYYEIGIRSQNNLPYAPSSRCEFEMALLRMLAFKPKVVQQSIPETRSPQPKNTVKPPSSSPSTLAIQVSDWVEMLPRLQLSGASLALAQNCSKKCLTNDQLHLILDPKQKPLLQKKYVDRISEAVSQYLNRPIQVNIEIGHGEQESPAAQQVKKQQDQQAAAKQTLMADTKVQEILKIFNATLDDETIQTNN